MEWDGEGGPDSASSVKIFKDSREQKKDIESGLGGMHVVKSYFDFSEHPFPRL